MWSSWPCVRTMARTRWRFCLRYAISGMTRSMPRSSDSGNIIPASITMMSSPKRSAIMFMPNSPRPPRGIAKRDCRDLLNELSAPRVKENRITSTRSANSGASQNAASLLRFSAEETRYADQNQRSSGCGREGVVKVAGHDAEVVEQPTAEHGTNQSEHDVRDATVAAAAKCKPREPASNQSYQEPRPEAVAAEVPHGNFDLQDG